MRKSFLIISLIVLLFVTINPVFAGRYYIPEIGRWATPDPLADKYPNSSPYVYCGNNPLKYIDPDGNYKMNINLVYKYPKLMSIILNTEKLASQSSNIQQIFENKIGASVDEFIGFGFVNKKGEMIKGVGNGPEIQVKQFMDLDIVNYRRAGYTPQSIGKSHIEIAQWLVEKLDSSNPDEVAAARELIKRVILHETAHRLNKKGIDEIDNFFDKEAFGEPQAPGGDYFWNWWYNDVWKSENNNNIEDDNSWWDEYDPSKR